MGCVIPHQSNAMNIPHQTNAGLKKKRRCWKIKEEAPDCTISRNQFGRGFGPIVKTGYRMDGLA